MTHDQYLKFNKYNSLHAEGWDILPEDQKYERAPAAGLLVLSPDLASVLLLKRGTSVDYPGTISKPQDILAPSFWRYQKKIFLYSYPIFTRDPMPLKTLTGDGFLLEI